MNYLPIILTAVSLNAFAQIFLRKSMIPFSDTEFSLETIGIWFPQLVVNVYLWFGMMCYGFSIVIWLYVLSKTEVSYAYPFLSLGYIIIAIAGYVFFSENLSLFRISGILIICLGVVLISKS